MRENKAVEKILNILDKRISRLADDYNLAKTWYDNGEDNGTEMLGLLHRLHEARLIRSTILYDLEGKS